MPASVYRMDGFFWKVGAKPSICILTMSSSCRLIVFNGLLSDDVAGALVLAPLLLLAVLESQVDILAKNHSKLSDMMARQLH